MKSKIYSYSIQQTHFENKIWSSYYILKITLAAFTGNFYHVNYK